MIVIPANAFLVIPANAFFVIPANAGIQVQRQVNAGWRRHDNISAQSPYTLNPKPYTLYPIPYTP
jgi:hypothetical protein